MMRKMLLLSISSLVLVASWLTGTGHALSASAAASALGNASTLASTGTTTVTAAIAAYDDDLFQDGTTYTNNSTTVWIGDNRDPSASYAGLRFAGVAVPRGAAVQSASLRFYSIANNSLSFNVSIYGDASGNSAKFTGSSLPGGRLATAAKISYTNQPAWTAYTWYSVDVTPVIAELAGRADWASGNAMSLIAKGLSGSSGMRRGITGYSGTSSANVAQLVITYGSTSATATATPAALTATPTTVSATATPASVTLTPTAAPTKPPTSIAPTATAVPPTKTAVPPAATATPAPITTNGPAYYVSTTGNDGNPGSATQPWRTIGKAAASATAGVTVYIMGGTYGERLRPANSGTAGSPITFAAYPGQTVILDGNRVSVPNWSGLVDVSGRSYITVRGLTAQYSSYAGLFADSAQHIVFQGNHTLHSQASGIGVWSSVDVIADGNDVEDSNYNGGNEAVTFGTTGPFEIKYNKVHNPSANSTTSLKEGIDAKQGSHDGSIHHNEVFQNQHVALYVDAYDQHTYNIKVYDNRLHDSALGLVLASEAGGLLENVQVFNNVTYNITNCGMRTFGQVSTAGHPMQNISLVNNTIYNSGCGIDESNDQVTGYVVRNNVLSKNASQLTINVATSLLTIDHNLIDGASSTLGTSYVQASPLFQNPAGGDFHVQAGSPAIDAGASTLAPSADADGIARPGGAAYDIGAYER